jgi:hypothetical protein
LSHVQAAAHALVAKERDTLASLMEGFIEICPSPPYKPTRARRAAY